MRSGSGGATRRRVGPRLRRADRPGRAGSRRRGAGSRPGQYTHYYGYVGRPEGAIHFAGEHTATANQGFLEGAVRSGERAADAIAAAVG